MPMRSKDASTNIREFHQGGTFQKTKNKFGKSRSDKQAVAAGFAAARKASASGYKTKRRKGSY